MNLANVNAKTSVSDIFNDFSIHSFPSEKLRDITLWNNHPEPTYTEEDLELIKDGSS
jgi:hypothetical protein